MGYPIRSVWLKGSYVVGSYIVMNRAGGFTGRAGGFTGSPAPFSFKARSIDGLIDSERAVISQERLRSRYVQSGLSVSHS